jgi:hypothetical protein
MNSQESSALVRMTAASDQIVTETMVAIWTIQSLRCGHAGGDFFVFFSSTINTSFFLWWWSWGRWRYI